MEARRIALGATAPRNATHPRCAICAGVDDPATAQSTLSISPQYIMPLPPEVSAQLLAFHRTSQFATRGGVITDLDGTAVHERDGRIYIVEPVAEWLNALIDRGRPVVLNTLRFPLNVIRTFGHEWSAITAEPVPLVSLNGAVLGLLTPTDVGETTFKELVAFPLSTEQIEEAVRGWMRCSAMV